MVAQNILNCLESSSWVRRMFEAGKELKEKLGSENVFDFSLGNPCLDPHPKIAQLWQKHLQNSKHGKHGYTHNAGIIETRDFLASELSKKHRLPFTAEDILLCCGAGGGLNVVFHSLLNPKQEVLVSSPFFPEYSFYAKNHNAILKTTPSLNNFQLDLDKIQKSITNKTKIFLLNSPNNPTGAVYSSESLHSLCEILSFYSKKNDSPIYLVSDEPYARILFDNLKENSIFEYHQNTILVTSFSKDLSLAGERIGYIATHPKIMQKKLLMDAFIFSNRTLGFVNAPVSLQYLLPEIFSLTANYKYYWNLRDFLYEKLIQIGYKVQKPQGAFYFFPESLEEDDIAFVKKALNFGLLFVPGSGFGRKGYFRISYAVPEQVAKKSIASLKKLFNSYKN